MVGKTLPLLAVGLVVGSQSTWAGPIPRRSEKVIVDKRAPPASYRFGHPYADRTPCWVEGHRGWVKDQSCGDLIDIDTTVNVGKRHHSFDDPYFADGTPCFNRGREGIVEDLLCVDLDLNTGEHYPDSDYHGPWQFSHAYNEGQPCWVDYRRGYVHDGACGNLLDIDTDILLNRRYYKDDPYYVNGVPCVKDGREGVITDYLCIVADVKVSRRAASGRPGHEGCSVNGRWGAAKDSLCIEADVDVSARGLLDGNDLVGSLVGSVTGGHRYRPHNGRPDAYSHYREDEAIDVDTNVDVKRSNKMEDVKTKLTSDTKVDTKVQRDIDSTVKSDTRVKSHSLDIASDTAAHAKAGHKRRLVNDYPSMLDATSKTESDLTIGRRSHGHDLDKTAIDLESELDTDTHLKRGGDGLLLASAVKSLGKSVNDALSHGKRDTLGLNGLLDVVSAVDITNDGRGPYPKHKPGLLGGIVRRAPVPRPDLVGGLLGGNPNRAKGNGKKGGLLGGLLGPL